MLGAKSCPHRPNYCGPAPNTRTHTCAIRHSTDGQVRICCCLLDTERAMGATSWGEPGVRRVVVISGATAAVIIAALVAKPFYSAWLIQRHRGALT
jgi:hypothetical protein